MFAKVLVANRGEIAVRIMQTCAEMGIRTVAVYSEADAGALHVRRAQESYPIGPAAATSSYLCGDRIIEVARRCGAEAIHPGYGFLSENAEFAEACRAAGLVFIGPPPEAMRKLGSKAAARAVARAVGAPVVPGYDGEDQRPETLSREAERIGFPLLIKATAGGGGRGMRVVGSASTFEAALESARREALAAFGDDRVLLERAVPSPRHIEFQIMADGHGNVIHLGERDCSAQRRHQKLIEESPSSSLSPDQRAAMGAAAVAIMRAAGYVNAGTVEFLFSPSGDYYFLEVNTRLQVEHPVTESVTGLDLVREQIRIGAGMPLSINQEMVQVRGHAIECRVTAEDVAAGFLPSSGTLHAFALPAGPGIRNDVGVERGDGVTLFYDSMLAKLIVHAPDRAACIARARQALARYSVLGVQTNLALLAAVLDTTEFRGGTFTTDHLDTHLGQLVADAPLPELVLLAAASWQLARTPVGRDPWRAGPWRASGQEIPLAYAYQDREVLLAARRESADTWLLRLPATEHRVTILRTAPALLLRLDARTFEARVVETPEALLIGLDGGAYAVRYGQGLRLEPGGGGQHTPVHAAGQALKAPMPGTVIALHAQEGERVQQGQPVLVLEAMKMEHIIAAPRDGTLVRLRYGVGDRVDAGIVLAELED